MQAVVRKAYEDPRQVATSDSSDGFRLAYSHRRAVEYRVDTGDVSCFGSGLSVRFSPPSPASRPLGLAEAIGVTRRLFVCSSARSSVEEATCGASRGGL